MSSDLGPELPVRELVLDLIGQQVVPCPEGSLCVPSRPHEGILWDGGPVSTGTLKVIVDRKVRTIELILWAPLIRAIVGLASG